MMNINNKIIPSLYEYYKNTPKKLKIVCDWDEVIQACEPYANYLLGLERLGEKITPGKFPSYFKHFWSESDFKINYSPYGSKLEYGEVLFGEKAKEDYLGQQSAIKNSPDFYQKAPFLTIAEDLLKLIKEGKVEKLIFLSAYDKRKFPNGDSRKKDIFRKTFSRLARNWEIKIGDDNGSLIPGGGIGVDTPVKKICFQLIGFDSETQGQSKAGWIKENASDFDMVIDDNPNICGSIVSCQECLKEEAHESDCMGYFKGFVLAPYYPAVENQHSKEVLLVKNGVSDLKKEDFGE